MLNGIYKQFLNGIALKQLDDRPLDLPNENLGVGGHDMTPQPLLVSYKFSHAPTKAVIPDPHTLDQMMVDGHAVKIGNDEFPKSYYFGDALGGI